MRPVVMLCHQGSRSPDVHIGLFQQIDPRNLLRLRLE